MQRDGHAGGGADSQCRSKEATEYAGSRALLEPLQISLQPTEGVAQMEIDQRRVTFEEGRCGPMIEPGLLVTCVPVAPSMSHPPSQLWAQTPLDRRHQIGDEMRYGNVPCVQSHLAKLLERACLGKPIQTPSCGTQLCCVHNSPHSLADRLMHGPRIARWGPTHSPRTKTYGTTTGGDTPLRVEVRPVRSVQKILPPLCKLAAFRRPADPSSPWHSVGFQETHINSFVRTHEQSAGRPGSVTADHHPGDAPEWKALISVSGARDTQRRSVQRYRQRPVCMQIQRLHGRRASAEEVERTPRPLSSSSRTAIRICRRRRRRNAAPRGWKCA